MNPKISAKTWLQERRRFMEESDYYNSAICEHMRDCKIKMSPEAYEDLLYYMGETQTGASVFHTSGGTLLLTKPNLNTISMFATALQLLSEDTARVSITIDSRNGYNNGDEDDLYELSASWTTMSELLNDYLFPDYCIVQKDTLEY